MSDDTRNIEAAEDNIGQQDRISDSSSITGDSRVSSSSLKSEQLKPVAFDANNKNGNNNNDIDNDPEKHAEPREEEEEGNEDEDLVSLRLSRSLSRALTNADYIEGEAMKDTSALPRMGPKKDFPKVIPARDEYTVEFDGPNDPIHPHNWPLKKKLSTCFWIACSNLSIAWGSSAFSPGTAQVAKEFHVGTEVAILGTSLFVAGFATGPVIWAPLSELYGRKIVLVLSGLGFMIFQFAIATAKDIQTIIICRCLGGMIGAAPLVVVPAAFADLFGGQTRGKAITIYSMTVFTTPVISPVVSTFITDSYLGWRWTEYITGIMAAVGLILVTFFFEETHHPIILVKKANYLRRRTGNWAIHAPHDEVSLSIREIVEKNITRPLVMLFTEPIILLLTIYNAFIYGILYLLLTSYPIIFAEGYKMKGGVAELPYLAVAIGQVFGGCYCIYAETLYLKAVARNNGKSVPEARLLSMLPGAIMFPIGLFWLTWTGNYHNTVHWMAPTAAGVFIGFGLLSIFNACINYIVESYLFFAASAMAANAFLRAAFACAFPLFGTQMFHAMGINWAGLLLAAVGFVLMPVPFLFYKFGERIRIKSKYAFATK